MAMLILRKTWCYICHLSDQRMMLRHFCMTDQMESSKSISFNHDGKDFFSTIQICFVRWCQNTVIGEKSSKGLRLITRQIYWLLLPFALGLDGHLTSSNKTKSHTHKKHYWPNTNHNQVNPYPNPQCCSSWKYEFGYLENPSFDSIPFFDVRAYNWRLIFPWSVDNCLNPPSSLEDPLCTFRNWQVWHRVSLGVTSSATDDLAPGMTWTTTTKWSWRSTEQLENFY